MTFNSFSYLLFLPLVYLACYFGGERTRPWVLLAASFLFYAALKVPYLLVVLVFVGVTTFWFGLRLHRAATPRTRCALLWCGITVDLLVLVTMKYLPGMSRTLALLCNLVSPGIRTPALDGLVAVGTSYYVLQAVSYLVEVYLEVEEPERELRYFFLYLAFFPKLLQGPIERAGDLIPQLRARYVFDYDKVRSGLLLFAWGLFKKIVLADRLGLYVDSVYGDVHAFTGLPLLLATYGYAFQIYLDFSGYTDMALGSARLFDVELTQNFNSPYLAVSVADFWRRWHISFSRWILEHLFRPLQMRWRDWNHWGTGAALVATFLISGLWHGATWGFLVWGGLHGLYMACSVFYRPYQNKLHRALGMEKSALLRIWRVLATFHLVSFAWIFFRASSLRDAGYVIRAIWAAPFEGPSGFLLLHGRENLSLLLVTSALYLGVVLFKKSRSATALFQRHSAFRWVSYVTFVIVIVLCAVRSTETFIYQGF